MRVVIRIPTYNVEIYDTEGPNPCGVYWCCALGTNVFLTGNNRKIFILPWRHYMQSLGLIFFLGAFAESRKATISFVMSVCPSVRFELGSHQSDLHEMWYLSIFRKSVETIQVSSKSDKKNAYIYINTNKNVWSYLAHFFLDSEMFESKAAEKVKTQILF
jgi:hypothetical protein